MSRTLIIHPAAEDDLIEARDWYENRHQGLGYEFLSAVDVVFDRIVISPELYAPEYKSVRRCGTSRFPYIIYFRLVDDIVYVLAVLHGSRSPREWRSRA